DNYEPISKETEDKVIENLRKISGNIDVLCVADQFRFGIITKRVRDEIIALAKSGLPVIADSRYNIGKYTDCILKPNEVECWRAVYNNEGYIDAGYDEFIEAAKLLAKKNRSTVFCTLGKRGSIVTDGDRTEKADAVLFDGEVDICGAGDTSLSAFSAAIAAKTELKAAAQFAGLASGVTVRKIGVTGTASPEEIEALAQ
ncbi:MAG: PfkB family carbohydrate kinase, partial [Clostridiales bacterium]